MCTQHLRSVRQHRHIYTHTHTAGAAIFTDFPSNSFRLFLQCAAIYVFIHCAFCCRFSFSPSACYPCAPPPSLVVLLAARYRCRCRLVYCVIVGKWRPNLRLGLILTIALVSLSFLGLLFCSILFSVLLLSLSLPFGLAFVYNHVKLNCFAHIPHLATATAAAAATSVSI